MRQKVALTAKNEKKFLSHLRIRSNVLQWTGLTNLHKYCLLLPQRIRMLELYESYVKMYKLRFIASHIEGRLHMELHIDIRLQNFRIIYYITYTMSRPSVSISLISRRWSPFHPCSGVLKWNPLLRFTLQRGVLVHIKNHVRYLLRNQNIEGLRDLLGNI